MIFTRHEFMEMGKKVWIFLNFVANTLNVSILYIVRYLGRHSRAEQLHGSPGSPFYWNRVATFYTYFLCSSA